MRKSAQLALVTVIVLLLGSTAVLYQKYRQTSASLTQTKSAEEEAKTRYAEAFSSIAEIQYSLNAIALGQGAVPMVSQNLQSEQRMSGPDRREALDRIAQLNASIQRTKTKIHELEGRLRKSGIKIAGLQKMVENLKTSVTEKETQVAELTTKVDALQTQVTGLETTVASQEQNIEEKRKELGTVYYIVGTKRDLATSGVIVSKGGLLGLGKTQLLTGRYNETLFTPIDTDVQTTIHAPAAKVRVLSPQPLSSYELVQVGTETELHILDPKEFRKVKHVVIMTTT